MKLPKFPLTAMSIATKSSSSTFISTPTDFHKFLTTKIPQAKSRVSISSLYVGVGSASAPLEREFLGALSAAPPDVRMRVVMDYHRGRRPVGDTSSAAAVSAALKNNTSASPHLFRVPTPAFSSLSLPTPINEVAGVMHMKAYIVDDEMILTGANLSEEYFSDRLDRYVLFRDGAGGLVDFYADLIDAMAEASHVHGETETAETDASQHDLVRSVQDLMEAHGSR